MYGYENVENVLLPIIYALFFTILCIYLAYNLFCVGEKPKIVCGGASLRQLLDFHMPISKEKYWPTWWCLEGRLHTIVRRVIQSSVKIEYKNEILLTEDGGEVHLDWCYNDIDNHKQPEAKARPTVIVFPGIVADSRKNDILQLVKTAMDLGYRCVVMVYRGLGNSTLKTPRTYCAANIEDASLVVNHVKTRFPESPLVATGSSLGGTILLNYLTKSGSNALVDAAIVFSACWNAFAVSDSMSTSLNKMLFNKYIARDLCKKLTNHSKLFTNHPILDIVNVLKSKTVQEFDERFTCKIFGYPTLHDYYSDASVHLKIHKITKPVLCLHAADDPFQPGCSIPLTKAEENENVAVVMTSHGGHVGFMEGTFPKAHNYMNRWFKQYLEAVITHKAEVSR